MNAVVITKEERNKMAGIGTARNACKRPEMSRRMSDVFSDSEVDVLGMMGEYAVAEYLGASVDESIHMHGDNGTDLTFRGHTVSVKYNHRWRGFLMVEERQGDDIHSGLVNDLKTDLIVLSHGKCMPPKTCVCRDAGGIVVVLAGWLTRDEFISTASHRDLGLGGRYIVTCDKLRPMHEIWSISA
jgi:hypothetical protein